MPSLANYGNQRVSPRRLRSAESYIAEGVETNAQLCHLTAHGCDQIQGYYVSRLPPTADWSTLFARGPLSLFTGSQVRH